MKVLILKDRNNKLITSILKVSKKNERFADIYYSDNGVYFTDGLRALKINSDFFSFDFQPENNTTYTVVSKSNNKPGIMYYLEKVEGQVPQFNNVFFSDDVKKSLFSCQIDSDIIANNVIINIYKAIECGIRYDFIKDLICNDNELIEIYGIGKHKPIMFEYTGSQFIIMPYKVKDVL